ncbi:MAG: chromate efflux transporter [Acidimicrobiales bacterium]|jgi:chromate transporter
MSETVDQRVPLTVIVREWGRIGTIGFGGPPAHIALFRKLCVDERAWLTAHEFEDGIAATNLLPGPASTQLAIYCAWRLRGRMGAVVGGICFIIPGLVMILALSALFLSSHPPLWVLGMAAGAGAAVPAVALSAASGLLPASWQRAGSERSVKIRWIVYFLAGGVSAATIGPFLVLVLIICGAIEIAIRSRGTGHKTCPVASFVPLTVLPAVTGGVAALCWVAFKVGALSYGGGFVIIPLMQHDAVVTYHWMTGAQFLNAVALGQVTPGPVVQTVAVVGYAARGLWGGLLAAAVAFAPSFVFVIAGARHFDRLRSDPRVQAFFVGAGSAVIGAIAGSSIPLGLELAHLWQVGVLAVAAIWMLVLRRGVVLTLVGAGIVGLVAVLAGAPS